MNSKLFIPDKVWFIGLLVIVALSGATLIALGWNSRVSTTNQVLKQEQTLSRAEAGNIETFFQSFGNSIAVLAQLNSMENPGTLAQANLDRFIEQWRSTGIVGGILLLNGEGKVIMNSNVDGTRTNGASLSDRDYFVWAKSVGKEGEYFIGRPVISRTGASKGQVVTVVASPIYKNGEFFGALASSVEIDPLTDRFLGLMKVSNLTSVYVIGVEGNLWYSSPDTSFKGMDILGQTNNTPFLGNQNLTDTLENALSKAQEGTLETSFKDPKTNKVGGHLVAYSPIDLVNKKWLLVMVSPISEVTKITNPIYVKQVAVFLLFVLSLVTFRAIAIRRRK